MTIAPLKKTALEDSFGAKSIELIDQFTRFHFGEFNRGVKHSNLGAELEEKHASADVDPVVLGASGELSNWRQSFESINQTTPVVPSVAETFWEKLYRARQQIHSDAVLAQAQLIACAELDVFIAPHALRSLAELHAMKKEFEQEKKARQLAARAQSHVAHWYDLASEIDIAEMQLRTNNVPPLVRSKIIVALKKFGAESALLVATTIAGFAQYEHLFFILEFNGGFDAAADAIGGVRADGFTHQVIDYDELDEELLRKIRVIPRSKLY